MGVLKINKKILATLLLIFIGFITYKYIYKSHRNIKYEEPFYIVISYELVNEFTLNNKTATEKYLDKTIQVSGVVTSVDDFTIVLDENISCYFNNIINYNKLLSKKITVKGRCLGFDDLLGEVKIDQCEVIKIN